MDRRKYLKTSGALCGLGVVSSTLLVESCKKSNSTSTTPQGPTVNFTIDLSQPANNSLNTPGGTISSNLVVVANDGGTFISVAQRCTHSGCSVYFNLSGHSFVCPCHGGTFDNSGNVTGGPPPAPLKKYTVTRSGNILTIAG